MPISSRNRRTGGGHWLPILLTLMGLTSEAVLAVSPRPDALGSWVVFLDDCDRDDDGEEAGGEIVDLERTWPQAKVVARGARQRGRGDRSSLAPDRPDGLHVASIRLDGTRLRPGLGVAARPAGLPVILCRLTC